MLDSVLENGKVPQYALRCIEKLKKQKSLWGHSDFCAVGFGWTNKKNGIEIRAGEVCVGNAPEGVLRKKYKYAYNLPPMHFWEKIKALL